MVVAGGYHGFGQPHPSDLSSAEVNKPERTRESQRDIDIERAQETWRELERARET